METSSARPRLLLVPGLLCDRELWCPQVAALADLADIRVADITGSDTIAALAETAVAGVEPPFALAGRSMGGYVALEIALRWPERVGRLALLDTQARDDGPEQAARRRGLLALARGGRFQGVTDRLLPLLVHPSRLAERDLTDTIKAMAARVGRDAFVRQQSAILARADRRPELARIDCPTLVLCGRQDALTPLAESEAMAIGVRNARLIVIEECGHLSTLERPEEVGEALRGWLLGDG